VWRRRRGEERDGEGKGGESCVRPKKIGWNVPPWAMTELRKETQI